MRIVGYTACFAIGGFISATVAFFGHLQDVSPFNPSMFALLTVAAGLFALGDFRVRHQHSPVDLRLIRACYLVAAIGLPLFLYFSSPPTIHTAHELKSSTIELVIFTNSSTASE